MAKKRSLLFRNGQTVVFIGDSITDCGRRDSAFPFGDGYVRMVIDLIAARYPDRRIEYFNHGIGGDTSTGLRNRWGDDVLVHKPDWVSVMIGINDLHQTLLNPNESGRVPPDLYARAYEDFLTRTRKDTTAGIVLMDPFYISTESDPAGARTKVLALLRRYVAVVRKMARQFDAIHVPLHDIFQRQLRYRAPDAFCPEPVHPNDAGHRVIAEAFLSAVGW